MNMERKKQLLEEYKNRKPEKGVIAFKCIPTGDVFLRRSDDTKADYNSVRFKLVMNSHPNKELQKLWKDHGEDQFEFSVLKVLKYDNPNDDHTEKLEALQEKCMEENPAAKIIWK